MEIENIPISEIIPYGKNPRRNDGAVEVVAKSIREFGFRVPIILDKNNVIIAGHTRLKAAIKLGMFEVPVVRVKDLTEDQTRALRLMDNKSHEYSDWDFELLLEELDELKKADFDLDLTGFKDTDIENITKYLDGKAKEIDEDIPTENECPKCGYRW
jgi:ParB-like chromosome segregation protein Spo0J